MTKIRKRLFPYEAKILGKEPKENTPGRNQAPYYITQDEWEIIKEGRITPNERKMVTVQEKYDKNGNIVSSIDKLQSKPIKIPEGFEIIKISTSETTGQQWVQYAKLDDEQLFDLEATREAISQEFNRVYEYKETKFTTDKEAALKWADLHFGAHIYNLTKTQDYDSNILLNGLCRSVDETNAFGFKKVHVHINGDLIESFSGLNHINSWMSLNKDETGTNAIKLCCKLLHEAISKINNLGKVLIVAGNHDRTSKRNDEDVKGGAADLIAWGLELMGYDVEFDPICTTQIIDGIKHINLHGDKGVSKRGTKDIIWDYGTQGLFNFVFEAHLHSIIQKLSVSQAKAFKTIKDDSIDHRRMHLPPFFTGNYYSESLNYFTNSGYTLVWDNGKGVPNVFTGAI